MRLFVLRGEILDYLRLIGDRTVDELEIIHVFYQEYRDTHIKDALFYLSDKGYIDKKEISLNNHRYKKKTTYRITAKGIDLLDGFINDTGVAIPDEKN